MKNLFLSLLCIFSLNAFAQKTDTLYFNEKWKPVEKGSHQYFSVFTETKDKPFLVYDYYANGELLKMGYHKSINPSIKHGLTTYFHKNGNVKKEINYTDNKNLEAIKEFDENGKLTKTYFQQLVYSKENDIITKKTIDVSTIAEFGGSTKDLYTFLSKNIRYPAISKSQKVAGKVEIGFTVTETGKLTNFEVLNAPSVDLGEEGIRVAQLMPNWIPAEQNGKKIPVNLILPIQFNLQN